MAVVVAAGFAAGLAAGFAVCANTKLETIRTAHAVAAFDAAFVTAFNSNFIVTPCKVQVID
jgi:hypothetical protein